MKFKKLGKKLIIPVAMCMILAGGVIQSFANNSGDRDYNFYFSRWGDTEYTDGRAKNDKTSSYMKCKELGGNYSYKGTVVASHRGGYTELEGTPSYTFKRGTVKFMANYVKERNFTAASIKARMSMNPVNVIASGSWSPDSVR